MTALGRFLPLATGRERLEGVVDNAVLTLGNSRR